jgi:hypothetical protein
MNDNQGPISSIKRKIQEDANTALKAGEKFQLGVLRLALSSIKQYEVDNRKELDNDHAFSILEKMVKQRQEAIALFKEGGRMDIAEKESKEIEILKRYLPEPLDESLINKLVNEIIIDLDANSLKDMGKVMKEIQVRAKGRVDMKLVSEKIKNILK